MKRRRPSSKSANLCSKANSSVPETVSAGRQRVRRPRCALRCARTPTRSGSTDGSGDANRLRQTSTWRWPSNSERKWWVERWTFWPDWPATVRSPHHLGFDEYVDPVSQILISHHYFIDGDRGRTVSVAFRYVWPSELDLMAEVAGMTLEQRWADRNGAPFTADSPSHVSVWRKR